MASELNYGTSASVRIDMPVTAVLADFPTPRGEPLDNPVAAVAAALLDPLDFPPMPRSTVPGDQIVLAVDRAVPQAAVVVAGVVHALLDGNAEASDIIIISTDLDPTRLTSLLAEEIRSQISVITHDPRAADALGFLATSQEGKQIRFHRVLLEADVVLPIGTLRLDEGLSYFGINAGLFPMFSDAETIERFRSPGTTSSDVHQRRRSEEAEEAVWLLGSLFTLQVAPGPRDSILHVLAGDARSVAKRGRELCEAAWKHQSPSRAELVVASIEGGPEHQTWDNFSRALFSASHAVRDGGAIVLCTELGCPPGPALQKLTADGTDDQLMQALRRDRSEDAVAAALLVTERRRVHVYLLSHLASETVEDLGLGYVASTDDVERLSRQFESCILLGNAQHAVLATADE
ncbi:MAG TPA: lactate racemase domain-containing protein [Pirellulaceae bacterium]|jgi:nickel-dependent lactate racemase|nr:lactate racemase domain-containing protein [Pirellulaceae bacterium]